MIELLFLASLLSTVLCLNMLNGAALLTNTIPETDGHQDYYGQTDLSLPPFPPMENYRPSGKQLKTKKLLRRMGNDFDRKWMSISEPLPIHNERNFENYDESLFQDVLRLNILLKSESGRPISVSNETLQAFRNWLMEEATCNVRFVWNNLGEFYWPRYIKKGLCNTGKSCSWPAGMRCVENESKILRVLRWHCKHKKRKGRSKDKKQKNRSKRITLQSPFFRRVVCKWTKIPYPVTHDCICSC